MKQKITLDRSASSSAKLSALGKVMRDLGSRVTISGNLIVVDSYDAKKVTDILAYERVGYSVQTY